MNHRIIFYYQTFSTLKPILIKDTVVTHIHVSSIHFGIDGNNQPYIHLNDYPPNHPKFTEVWNQLEEASKLGIKIVLMIGGAGKAFSCLFSNFDIYYKLLKDVVAQYPFISGFDLDVEECVPINNIKKLISQINIDYGNKFIISMAPVAFALEQDTPGLGGFNYKELYNSLEGQRINYFNTQFYYDFDEQSYQLVINNGYPPSKIVLGMTSNIDVNKSKTIVHNLCQQYSNFGGVYDWEYFDAGSNKPYQWALTMSQQMESIEPKSYNIYYLYQYIVTFFYK